MSVTGTQQRVYGTLVADNCNINIRRFAIVMDNMDKSPIQSSNVVYADAVPMTQTGYLYNGYITLFMFQDTGNVYAAIEVKICKTYQRTIIIDSYGEIELPTSEIYEGISLWFDKNNTKYFASQDDFPETGSITVTYVDISTGHSYIWTGASYTAGNGWTKLNDAMYGSKMNHFKTTFDKFKEDGKTGLTTINCCKNCPDECKQMCQINANIYAYNYLACVSGFEKITLSLYTLDIGPGPKRIPYGINNLGYETIYYPTYNICVEYRIDYEDEFVLKMWIYPKSQLLGMVYIDIYIILPVYWEEYQQSQYKNNKFFRISGFISDFEDFEEITIPIIYNGFCPSPISIGDPNYTTLINKTIKIEVIAGGDYIEYQYAKIVNIEKDLNDRYVLYIDPDTIVSSEPAESHEIQPIIDGEFEIIKQYWYDNDNVVAWFKVVDADMSLRDLYRDLTMTIEITDFNGNILSNALSSYMPVCWGALTVFDFPYDESVEMTDVTPNEDHTRYTVHWSGPVINDDLYYINSPPQTICIRTKPHHCFVKLTGTIRWYTSTGREIHYGDKGLHTSIFPQCEWYTSYRSALGIIS